MKRNLFKVSIFISLSLLVLEIDRWNLTQVNYDKWTLWEFLTSKGNIGFLWNLSLAWVAVFLGWLIFKTKNRIWTKFLSLLWILWLPNTLYMITDLKYFGADKTTSFIHDIVFYALFFIAGLVLYTLAVYLVWLKYKFGKKWFVFITSLTIIGVGIGRVLRWNSWDVFTEPQKILTDIINLF